MNSILRRLTKRAMPRSFLVMTARWHNFLHHHVRAEWKLFQKIEEFHCHRRVVRACTPLHSGRASLRASLRHSGRASLRASRVPMPARTEARPPKVDNAARTAQYISRFATLARPMPGECSHRGSRPFRQGVAPSTIRKACPTALAHLVVTAPPTGNRGCRRSRHLRERLERSGPPAILSRLAPGS
jgi:hypothetical protein